MVRAVPQPDPLENETSWWYQKMINTDRPVVEIFPTVDKKTAAGEIVQLWTYQNKVIVPPCMRAAMVWHVHRELYHRGSDNIYQSLTSLGYFWPHMKAFILDQMRLCNFCHHKRHVESIRDVEYHRKEIHPVNHCVYMDVFHASKIQAKGFPMLSMMDASSRFAKAICLKNTSAAKIIRTFHIHWVANFGKPVEVYVDCGTNFGSYEFKQ